MDTHRMSFLFSLLLLSFFLSARVNASAGLVSADNRSVSHSALEMQDTARKGVYVNPVIPGDFADPSVIKVGDTYYATGTSSEWGPHYPIYTSKDLVNWTQLGYIFREPPAWTSSSFWAPELFYYRNTFYVYYTARRKSDGISCIGVATASDPANGFTDHGVLVEHGKEAIDGFVTEDNGQLFFTFKAYGLDNRPIEILGCRLSDDGLSTEGNYVSLLRDDARVGLEGQVLMKHNDHYYLFYSAGGCCGARCSYNVRVARATSIRGPYEIFDGNPLLSDGGQWKCPGHGTIVQPDAERYFYLYHAYRKKDDVFTGRQGMLDELKWDDKIGWPYFAQGKEASVESATPLSDAGYAPPVVFRDEFDGTGLLPQWSWDFRNAVPEVAFNGGSLQLGGKVDSGNFSGTVLAVRPVTGTYDMTTEVAGGNAALKGLVVYGDVTQSVSLAVAGDKVEVYEVREGKLQVLASKKAGKGNIRLRIAADGPRFRFYYARGKRGWEELRLPGASFYDGAHLPQWDRCPRPGLFQRSEAGSASFSFFEISYR